MLIGRSAECGALDRLLEGGRAGRSGALVLRGEPGVGKTALLEYAAERADGQVLRGTGIQAESELAFAALHQLLHRDLEALEALPEPQAAALRVAFGEAPAARTDPFLISLAVLSLLAELAEEQPVVCLIDDAQWLDTPSAAALLFAARRIEAEGVVMLFVVREGETRAFEAPGLPTLVIGPLDDAAAQALLELHIGADVADAVRDTLVEQAGGVPLALLDLPHALTAEQLAGREPLAEPLRVSAGLEDAYLSRVRRLPLETQALLLAAAAEDSGELATILRAASVLELSGDDFGAAERDGLIHIHDGHLAFRHPLVRSAIYRGATFVERKAVHEALARAQTETNRDRRAWHRAAAADGPDEAIAAELEDSAEDAVLRGGYMAAALTLEKAATLSPKTKERTLRLLAAADAAWSAGSADRARGLLADAGRAAPADLSVDVTKLQGRIEVRRGDFEEALTMLLQTAEALLATDPAAAVRVLADAEEATVYIGDPDAIVRIGSLVEQAAGTGDADIDPFLTKTLTAIGYIFGGDAPRAAPLLQAALGVAAASDDLDQLLLGQRVAALLGDDEALVALPARAVRLARDRGAIGFLPRALERLAYSELRSGRYASARADAAEALRLARETGQESGTPLCLLAIIAGIQGREDECRTCAAEALERARERRSGIFQVLAMWGMGLLELGSGRPAEALSALDSVLPGRGGLTHPTQVLFLLPDHVEAAVRAGQPDRAEVSLTMFEGWADLVREPWALALLAHCRGLVADGEAAEAHFQEALELLSSSAHPFEQARSALALGEALRRNRKRRDARDHLRAALNAFEGLGATPWMERATKELRASGETARKRDASTLGDLTPQELQIARLVAGGARNRDVAAQLFLSPRTIDYHLRKVFTKLGISSRAELGQLDLDEQERAAMAVVHA